MLRGRMAPYGKAGLHTRTVTGWRMAAWAMVALVYAVDGLWAVSAADAWETGSVGTSSEPVGGVMTGARPP